MKPSRTIAYAILAMKYLANQPAGLPTPNSEICKAANLPERYVLQVLRKLVNTGVLVGMRGVSGGYKLAKPASKITLLEIVEAIDGPIGQSDIVDLPAAAMNAFAAIENDARKRLSAVTLAKIA